MANFKPPELCMKCGGTMQEGFAVDNSKVVSAGHPAYGKRVKLGGSSSWWQVAPAKQGQSAGILGEETFKLDLVLAGESIQVFTYRCQDCGYLESYAPDH